MIISAELHLLTCLYIGTGVAVQFCMWLGVVTVMSETVTKRSQDRLRVR